MLSRRFGGALLLAFIAAGPVDSQEPPPGNEIIVTGQRFPIVMNGKAVRCRPLSDDPQDSWVPTNLQIQRPRRSVLVPRPDGRGFDLVDDDGEVGGFGVWRRAGTRLDQYVFRGPTQIPLLCIGSKGDSPEGYAQLRLTLRAAPFHGKRLRFTGWVASRDARAVSFWLWAFDPNEPWGRHIEGGAYEFNRFLTANAHGTTPDSGDSKTGWIYNGGNVNRWWGGSHGWTPVLIEIGPVSVRASLVSLSLALTGHGDVWLYNPKLEIAGPDDPFLRKGDVFVIGTDQERSATRTSASHQEQECGLASLLSGCIANLWNSVV